MIVFIGFCILIFLVGLSKDLGLLGKKPKEDEDGMDE